MTFVIVMGFHQIIVVMNDVKRHTYIHTYIHLMIDLRRVNEKNPPSLARSSTSNSKKQYCYFVSQHSDSDYDIFVANNIKDKTFVIHSTVNKTNFGNRIRINAVKKLERIRNSRRRRRRRIIN